MKKTILTMAIALMGVIGFSASAQNAPQNKMYQPQQFTDFAFEGILLDINQQTRIDSLNAAVKPNRPAPGKDMKRPGKPVKAHGQQCTTMGDSCAKIAKGEFQKAPKGEMKGQRRGPKDGRMGGPRGMNPLCPGAEYVAKVKEILTPEQFEVFMTNVSNYAGMDKAQCRMGAPGNADCKKAECKKDKADCKKADCKKGDCKKADCKKADCKKADCKKADCKDCKDCKKTDCKKADCKKADCKKADCKKTK